MYLPRSLQSRVSTIHTVALTADVFQFFIKNIYNTRERPTIKLVELSINNHVLIAIHKHHKYYSEYYFVQITNEWNIAQARPMTVSDVSRSLQSWVSLFFSHKIQAQQV